MSEPDTKSSRSAESRRHGRWYPDACGAAFAMELIGERWSLPIIREMMLGPRRFSEIRAELPSLSAKTLTERLATLENVGIVVRRDADHGVQLYDLTDWGRGLEPVMQELGRWSVQSPGHDPSLPLTPVSLMLSLRTMIDPAKARALTAWIAFEVGDMRFAGRLKDGELSIRPGKGTMPSPDLVFRAESANDYLPVFYGKRSVEEAGNRLTIQGDARLAKDFIALFRLPGR